MLDDIGSALVCTTPVTKNKPVHHHGNVQKFLRPTCFVELKHPEDEMCWVQSDFTCRIKPAVLWWEEFADSGKARLSLNKHLAILMQRTCKCIAICEAVHDLKSWGV